MDINHFLIGQRVKTGRISIGITQKRLGELIKVTRVSINELEQGTRGITVDKLLSIARALEYPPAYFLQDIDMPAVHPIKTGHLYLSSKIHRQLDLLPKAFVLRMISFHKKDERSVEIKQKKLEIKLQGKRNEVKND